MYRVGILGAALASLVVAAAPAAGPPAGLQAAAPDVRTLGPQVGDRVPDFSLPDQGGRTRSLTSLMGPAGLVLVFSRSADW